MTRDEYILLQFRESITLNRVLYVGQFIAGFAGIALAIVAVPMGKIDGALGIVPTIAYLFTAGMAARWKAEAFAVGLAEIEADPVDIVRAYRFSPETAKLVESVQLSRKTLFQLIVSYGIIMILLFLVSALCLAFWQSGVVYIVAGSITLAMGLGMCALTVQSIRNWIIIKQLDKEPTDLAS